MPPRFAWILRPLCAFAAFTAGFGEASDLSAERSLSLAYGPSAQLTATVNRGPFGSYIQPILEYASDDWNTRTDAGFRMGLQYAYTAFTWRRLECRAMAGVGYHYAYQEEEQHPPDGVAGPRFHWDRTQEGGEIWIQPEFRLHGRFALLLEANAIRFIRTELNDGRETEDLGFVSPDFSVAELKVGIRYYLHLGRP